MMAATAKLINFFILKDFYCYFIYFKMKNCLALLAKSVGSEFAVQSIL